MNIFSALSTGKSRLHETSMSAMLAYFLNPDQDHGLGRIFLNKFLKLADENGIYTKYIDTGFKVEIDLEVQYYSSKENKRNDIDVQIKILDPNNREVHRILIENKIKIGAANSEQLQTYYQTILEKSSQNDDNFELTEDDLSVIFLTPESNNKTLAEEYSQLETSNKVWIRWNNNDGSNQTIVSLIKEILELEQSAQISPINEYMRHTFKAFAYYINQTMNKSSIKNRFGNIGEIVQEETISIHGASYEIVLRNSGQIQLFDEDSEKVQARPLLKQYIKENNITNKYDDAKGTTRQYGKLIFDYLNTKG